MQASGPVEGYDFALQIVTTEHEKKPTRKRYVRAVAICGGYLVKKSEDGKSSIFDLCMHSDIKVNYHFF